MIVIQLLCCRRLFPFFKRVQKGFLNLLNISPSSLFILCGCISSSSCPSYSSCSHDLWRWDSSKNLADKIQTMGNHPKDRKPHSRSLKSRLNLKTTGLSGQLRRTVLRLEHTKSLKLKEDPMNLVACCSSQCLQQVYLVRLTLPIYSNIRVSPYHITWRWLMKCYVNTLSVLTN